MQCRCNVPDPVVIGTAYFIIDSSCERHHEGAELVARILLIEDEKPLARLIAWVLLDAGHSVTTAQCVGDALETSPDQSPNVVVFNTAAPVPEKAVAVAELKAAL